MRKTKIISTIGPATRSPEMLKRLIDAGCNVIRINMSHSSQDEAAGIIADVRTISKKVALLLDTRGPEVRTTEVDETVELITGQEVILRGGGEDTAEEILVNYPAFHRYMEAGARFSSPMVEFSSM